MAKQPEKHKIQEQLLPLKINIDAYQPDPKNARTGHALREIGRSLGKYGQRKPIVVNKRTATIEAGNGTWQAAKDSGWTHIAAVVVEDDAETALGFSLADNRLADISFFDPGTLADILEGIDDPMDIPGVSEDWLEGLGIGEGLDFGDGHGEGGGGDTEPEIDRTEELREKWGVETGQLWNLGYHRILCGDSTKAEDVARVMGTDHYDLLLFDPPYEVENIFKSIPEFIIGKKLLLFWDYKKFGVAIKEAMDAGWPPLYEFIWDNVTSWYTPNRPLARHKGCGLFGSDEKWNFDKAIIRDGKKREAKTVQNSRGISEYVPLDGAVHLRTVEAFPTTAENGGHPHSKPVGWVQAMINGAGGGIVQDLFCGSGTSIIACENEGHICRAIEIDPAYVAVAIQRWVDHSGGVPEKT